MDRCDRDAGGVGHRAARDLERLHAVGSGRIADGAFFASVSMVLVSGPSRMTEGVPRLLACVRRYRVPGRLTDAIAVRGGGELGTSPLLHLRRLHRHPLRRQPARRTAGVGRAEHGQMQQITREFNYSESTFVLPPEKGHDRRVRIFTPAYEVPFAGHPNIGTAFVLATTGAFGSLDEPRTVVFEEDAGLVPVAIARGADERIRCELTAPQRLRLAATIPVASLAPALGVEPGAIVTAAHEPVVASVGLPFVIASSRTVRRSNAPASTWPARSGSRRRGGGPGRARVRQVERRVRHPRAHVLAARRDPRRPGNRQCQLRARRPAGRSRRARGTAPSAGASHRASRWDDPAFWRLAPRRRTARS